MERPGKNERDQEEGERLAWRLRGGREGHMQTYNGKDESVGKVIVEGEFHIILPQTQSPPSGHQG